MYVLARSGSWQQSKAVPSDTLNAAPGYTLTRICPCSQRPWVVAGSLPSDVLYQHTVANTGPRRGSSELLLPSLDKKVKTARRQPEARVRSPGILAQRQPAPETLTNPGISARRQSGNGALTHPGNGARRQRTPGPLTNRGDEQPRCVPSRPVAFNPFTPAHELVALRKCPSSIASTKGLG